MNLLEFQQSFSREEDCIEYLIQQRWPEGYACTRCGHGEAGYHPARRHFQCKACKYQQSVTAGTLFHKTRTPLQEWFWAIYLMSNSKKGISALELQRLLGAKDYERILAMKHRIRQAMENRESLYQLDGFVEVDEAFFGGARSGKPGRGSENKSVVLVSVSVKENDKPGYVKMTVIANAKGQTILETFKRQVKENSIAVSDGWPAYNKLTESGYEHIACPISEPKDNQLFLPWVNILISNAKRFIQGTHHSVRPEYLQGYLNEFCFRFNRRFFNTDLFKRTLFAGIHFKPSYLRA